VFLFALFETGKGIVKSVISKGASHFLAQPSKKEFRFILLKGPFQYPSCSFHSEYSKNIGKQAFSVSSEEGEVNGQI
jgi:hypothetical protein